MSEEDLSDSGLPADADTPIVAAFAADLKPGTVRRSIIWPWWCILLIVAGTVVAASLIQVIFLIAGFLLSQYPDFGFAKAEFKQYSEELTTTISGNFLMIVPTQLVFLVVAIWVGRMSGERWRAQMRLKMPSGATGGWVPAVIATIAVGMVPSMIFGYFFPDPDPYFESLQAWMQSVHGLSAVVLVILLSVTPGICEEFLFRGFLLGALQQRWSILRIITVTTLCFAAAHLHPTHALLIIPIGLWLTVMAIAYDSIYPCIIAHILNNAVAVSFTIWLPEDGSLFAAIPLLLILGLSAYSFLLALGPMIRNLRRASAENPTAGGTEGDSPFAEVDPASQSDEDPLGSC